MEKGTDPTSEPAQALARQWLDLIQEFTGGDTGIEQSLQTTYQQEGLEAASRGTVVAPEAIAMWEFMGKAISAKRNCEANDQLKNS